MRPLEKQPGGERVPQKAQPTNPISTEQPNANRGPAPLMGQGGGDQ